MKSIETAQHYYDAFTQGGDFQDVPFAEDVAFQGPTGQVAGAAPLREVLTALAQNVKGIEIRHQLAEGDQIVSFYDFDLGLPTGPIPMAERLEFKSDTISAIELLFDPRALGA